MMLNATVSSLSHVQYRASSLLHCSIVALTNVIVMARNGRIQSMQVVRRLSLLGEDPREGDRTIVSSSQANNLQLQLP